MSEQARTLMAAASAIMHTWEGRTEQPPGSNRIFVWDLTKPEWQGQPYCAATVVAAYLRCGIDLRKIIQNPYYVPNLEALAKGNGWWRAGGGRVGDLPIYGAEAPVAYHVGMSDPGPDPLYYAHEGNTSSGNTGSQDDGGGIYHRGRARSWIRGWVDMEKVIDWMIGKGLVDVVKAPAPVKPKPGRPALLKVDGEIGPATIAVLEIKLGLKASRAASLTALPSSSRKAVQKWLGVTADGEIGPITIKALQRKVGARADGAIGPITVKALQTYLNRGILAGKIGAK